MALRRALMRQPPLSCNLVLCVEKMAFASSCSSCTAPGLNPPADPAAACDDDPPADDAASDGPPAADPGCATPPVEAPVAPCPCDGDGTHVPDDKEAGNGDALLADPNQGGPRPPPSSFYTPKHPIPNP